MLNLKDQFMQEGSGKMQKIPSTWQAIVVWTKTHRRGTASYLGQNWPGMYLKIKTYRIFTMVQLAPKLYLFRNIVLWKCNVVSGEVAEFFILI